MVRTARRAPPRLGPPPSFSVASIFRLVFVILASVYHDNTAPMSNYARGPRFRVHFRTSERPYSPSSKQLFVVWPDPHVGPLGNARWRGCPRARIICSDETSVRIDGRTCWNWVFQNDEVVIHVVRKSRGARVVAEVLGGHRPAIWVSDLYSAQQGHAVEWQVCLAHQLRDCQFAIEAGDAVFAPRMKALLLRSRLRSAVRRLSTGPARERVRM
jgi:hypothetical protein